jgi:hypothetical protein
MYITNKVLLTAALNLLMLTSCVKIPVSKYGQLNSSTQNLNSKIADTYNRIEKIQRRYTVSRAPDTAIYEKTFVPMAFGESNDLTASLTHRAAAFDMIAKYTQVLYFFSSKDYLKDVDHASADLAASINTFDTTALNVKSGQATIIGFVFGELADAASKQLIDRKRLKILKQVMDSTQNEMVVLSGLLIHANKLYNDAVDQWRDALIRHANTVRPPYATPGRYDFDLEFANLLDEITDIKKGLSISNDALAQLPRSFSEIRLLLDKKDVKMNALKDLISEGQRLSDVYNNLDK